MTDQIKIKIDRVINLECSAENKVGESILESVQSIINYSLMALVICDKIVPTTGGTVPQKELVAELDVKEAYRRAGAICEKIMLKKNHDYGAAWKEMRITSISDMIFAKLLRIKQLEDILYKNNGLADLSTDIEQNPYLKDICDNFIDMVNYAIFYTILADENNIS
jgi:hypothetical protein